jgi:hypothetical protein
MNARAAALWCSRPPGRFRQNWSSPVEALPPAVLARPSCACLELRSASAVGREPPEHERGCDGALGGTQRESCRGESLGLSRLERSSAFPTSTNSSLESLSISVNDSTSATPFQRSHTHKYVCPGLQHVEYPSV